MKLKPNNYDKFRAIISYVDTFSSKIPVCHNAFYNMSKDENGYILKDFLFEKCIGFYYSREIDDYLFNMELAGLLACDDFNQMYIVKDKLKKKKNDLDKKDLKAIKKLSEYLKIK